MFLLFSDTVKPLFTEWDSFSFILSFIFFFQNIGVKRTLEDALSTVPPHEDGPAPETTEQNNDKN